MSRVRNKMKTGNKPVNFCEFRGLQVQLESMINLKHPKLKLKNLVIATCEFDYIAEQITLAFISPHIIFRPKSVKFYFRKQSVTASNFGQTPRSFKPSEVFNATASFTKIPIDFFGFSKDRTFSIVLEFEECQQLPTQLIQATFNITLPVVNQTEMFFKAPGTRYPDNTTRRICKQAFKMNTTNCDEEVRRCIILEEFKLMSVVDRYKIYGYISMLELFLDIENSFELDLVQKFNINNAEVKRLSAINYRINTAGQITSSAATVCLTPMDVFNSRIDPKDLQKLQIQAPIVNYHRNFVTIEMKRNKTKVIDDKIRYHIEFRPNFFSSAMAQKALNRIETSNYEKFMLDFTNDSLPVKAKLKFEKFNEIEWMNTNVGENFQQSQAIKHIVNRSSFPSPFIVFGPPGTGKTSTLVEAVAQIVKLQPTAKVLVTVNSNSACDEIGDRLLEFCGANKMFRFYAPSFSKKMNRVHPKLKSCSNLKYGYHIQPSIQELISYNVVICTLVNSGRMIKLGSHHFDFIFIDECASSAEPYVDIPMTLAMKKDEKFKASVILLGDPKQLGQIMRTYHSERYGFNISLMERVMGLKSYKFPFNPRFIVQLTDNFRSHVSILEYSNKKFYNSILNAKQLKKVANFAIGWSLLPNPNIPVVFHASWTPSELDGTSQFNHGDIAIVRKYVGSLLRDGINGKKVSAKDIGIISPYAAQRQKLMEIYTNGIEIGTVEYFQGREKLIVIVSSVRSKTPTIGFLKNEKRLNVALTRAKALLIVIGNPETLGKNQFWCDFITMCCEKKATVGNIPHWVWNKKEKAPDTEEDEDDVVRLEEMMNEMDIED